MISGLAHLNIPPFSSWGNSFAMSSRLKIIKQIQRSPGIVAVQACTYLDRALRDELSIVKSKFQVKILMLWWMPHVLKWISHLKNYKKHRKNCECCHHHSLFKGHNVYVKIVVPNCQKCYQCLKCRVSGHKYRGLPFEGVL